MTTSLKYKAIKLNGLYGTGRAAGMPATFYVAAYEVAPDDDGTGGTEMTYAGYARVALTNNDANFPVLVFTETEKVVVPEIAFPTPAADTEMCVALALHAHITNDDVVDFEALADPVSGIGGRPFVVPAGALVLAIP